MIDTQSKPPQVFVPPADPDANPSALAEAIARLVNRTPEQILAERAAIIAVSPKPRPLPEGKTLNEVIEGSWPGDETDEQIYESLKRLS